MHENEILKMMRAEDDEGRSHVNICGAITYIGFLFLYIFAFLASKWITDLEHPDNNVQTMSDNHDHQPSRMNSDFFYVFHLIGLILLIVPAVIYVVIGFRENMRSKKIFPMLEDPEARNTAAN